LGPGDAHTDARGGTPAQPVGRARGGGGAEGAAGGRRTAHPPSRVCPQSRRPPRTCAVAAGTRTAGSGRRGKTGAGRPASVARGLG